MIPYINPQSNYVLGPNGEQMRNLESQVLKNKNDIAAIIEGNIVLGELGIRVVGQVQEASQIPPAETYTGDYGDAFLVGEEAPYDFYIFTRPFSGQSIPQWFNLGKFPVAGPQGPQGAQGERGLQGIPGASILTGVVSRTGLPAEAENGQAFLDVQTGDLYRYAEGAWTKEGNITGPAGPIGPKGDKGDPGARGPQGIQGVQGATAYSVTYQTRVNTVDDLPDPNTVPRNYGYLVGTSSSAVPYMIIQDEAAHLMWIPVTFAEASSLIVKDGNYVAELDIGDYYTKAETDAAINANFNPANYYTASQVDQQIMASENSNEFKYVHLPSPSNVSGLIQYNGNPNSPATTVTVADSPIANTIVKRDTGAQINVPTVASGINNALSFRSGKGAYGIASMANFTSTTTTRTYNAPNSTCFGWGPSAGSSSSPDAQITNFVYANNTGSVIAYNSSHMRLLNCHTVERVVVIKNCVRVNTGASGFSTTAIATDKVTCAIVGDFSNNKIADLQIRIQPLSSVTIDANISQSAATGENRVSLYIY